MKDQDATDTKIKAEQLELAAADVERTMARVPVTPAAPPKPQIPLDPLMQAIQARWDEFQNEEADEDRRNLFLKTLDEPDLMDDEMAFGMLSDLNESAIQSGERDQVEKLIDALRERLPEVYATSQKFYVQWRIASAIASGRSERVIELACEMAETAGDDVDLYGQVVNRLAYHGALTALSQASQVAWPLIQTSTNILWGQDEYARWGADCVLFERLENSPDLDCHEPSLIGQTRFYFEDLQLEPFYEYVGRIRGWTSRTWSINDFDFKPVQSRATSHDDDVYDDDDLEGDEDLDGDEAPSEPEDPPRQALFDLADEFVDFAHRQEGVSYTKAALARANITTYILERHAGQLEARESMLDMMIQPNRKQRPKPKPRVPTNPLCPDRETLDRYLAMKLNMMNIQVYDVAGTLELIPTWLRFLETRGLLEHSQREKTIAELGQLHATIFKLFESDRSDPSLAENLRRWPENAARPAGT